MTMVVGFAPDGRAHAVLHLAAMLARSGGEELVVCAVVPAQWPPSPAKVDAEYQTYLQGAADNALSRARGRLPADVPASFEVVHARSAAAGLLEVAERVDASLIVVGSAAEGGSGMVAVGSASARLLHSSHVPVALAPRGFRVGAAARVARVTAAYGGTDDDLVVAAAGVAARVGAALRIASFSVRPRAPYTVAVGTEADDSMTAQWVDEISARAGAVLDEVADLPFSPRDCETTIGVRRGLGRGAGGRRVARRRRARRRLELDRAAGPRLPRLAGHQDRPPLPGPGRRRAARPRAELAEGAQTAAG